MKNEDIYTEIGSEFKKSPPLPESLLKENMLRKLETTQPDKKDTDISFLRTVVGIAAVFAVVVLSVIAFGGRGAVDISLYDQDTEQQTTVAATHQEAKPEKNPLTIKSSILKKAESEEALIALLENNLFQYEMTEDMAVNESVTVAGVTSALGGSGINGNSSSLKGNDRYYTYTFAGGTTNEQTVGVSEADIIKTDGRYLFILADSEHNVMRKKLQIFDTEAMTYVYDKLLTDKEGNFKNVSEMYLSGNTLTLVFADDLHFYGRYSTYGSGKTQVKICTYDVTDKTKPQLMEEYTQEGHYISSRMIGNILYTVTRYSVYGDEESLKTGYAPSVNGEIISCDCIFIDNEKSNSYMCLTAIDTSDPAKEVTKSAILTKAEDVYCSADTLYIYGTDYVPEGNISKEKTVINAFKLKGLELEHTASGKVGGRLHNQYSLDEYDGYLRLASNEYNFETDVRENLLYVLDSNLEVVGKIAGIAENENIKSVRFLGNEGYVVTYLNTDPLFCFDLSDPKNPKITGELKIPGYSTYLHPVGEDLLLGLGYDGTALSAVVSKVKLSLFDVSDMSNPKEVDSIVFKHSSSVALNDARAFLFDSQRNLLFLPVTTVGENFCGKVISVGQDSLELVQDIAHAHRYIDYDFLRTAYIGDNAFVVSSTAITKCNLTDGTVKNAAARQEEKVDVSYDTTTGGMITVNEGIVVGTTQGYTGEVLTTGDYEVKMTAPPEDLVGNYGTTVTSAAVIPDGQTSEESN